MTNDQFSVFRSISARSFDDEKATVAKQITGSNCLTVNQAKTIMMELTFDSAKLDYAKFASIRLMTLVITTCLTMHRF